MIHAQNHKVVATLPAAATGSTATATLTIDTRGWDHCSLAVIKPSGGSSTVFANVLKVEESDDNSAYSNVAALVAGGAGGFTLPSAATTVVTILKMDIDTKAKKRYLKVSYTPSETCTVAIVGRLGRGEEAPVTASEAGVIGLVKG